MELFLNYRTLCEIPERNASLFPVRDSHKFRIQKGFAAKTFSDFNKDIHNLAVGLIENGLKKRSHTAFFCDNRYEWSVTDYALMLSGAVSVPRGSDTTPIEQKFLYLHSDARFLIMENTKSLDALLKEFKISELQNIEKIFLMDEDLNISVLFDKYPGIGQKIIYYNST